MIAVHILLLSIFLTLTWGLYLIHSINGYLHVKQSAPSNRRKTDLPAALRRLIVAICVWTLPASFVIRTGSVLLGVGGDTTNQILFFALTGVNVVGSLFCAVSAVDQWWDSRQARG